MATSTSSYPGRASPAGAPLGSSGRPAPRGDWPPPTTPRGPSSAVRRACCTLANAHIVLGVALDDPVHLLICWTIDGKVDGRSRRSGGTGQALRIAAAYDVAAINLANPAHRAFASTFLTRP